MNNPIIRSTNTLTTQDWLITTRNMNLTAYDPSLVSAPELIEPDRAVNLTAAERERMNRARQGVRAPFEQS